MVKDLPANVGDTGLIPGSGRFPWRRKWQPTPVFLLGESHGWRSLVGYTVHRIAKSRTRLSDFTFTFMNYQRLARWHSGKESACQEMQETWIRSPGEKDPLEEEMATHSSILAWRISWWEEPDRLQSMWLQKRQTWLSDWACTHTRIIKTTEIV